MLVQVVELVLRAAVAGVAAALREPRHADRRVADAEHDTGVVDVVDPAAGDDERQRPGGERDDAVRPSDRWPRRCHPLDGHIVLDGRKARLDDRRQPGVAPVPR